MPIKAADTIQKIFFEEQGAATNQERLLIKKYFSLEFTSWYLKIEEYILVNYYIKYS